MTLFDEFKVLENETKLLNEQHEDNCEIPEVDLQVKQSGKSVRVQTDKPHLVSLGGGRLSTGITIHPLPEGTTYIGRADAVRVQDIIIQGPGAEREHCVIESTEGIVVLYPLCGVVTVDGVKVDSPVRLTQGCMLCFGRTNHFRFNHPQQAKHIKKILPNGDISVVPAVHLRDIQEIQELNTKEKNTGETSKVNKNPNSTMFISAYSQKDKEIWDSVDFVDKVSKFEYLAHRNTADDKSSLDSGYSDISWPTSPTRTWVSTPEHSPGCIILQQSHFNSSSSSNTASLSSSLNRTNEMEREKRKFLRDLYNKTRDVSQEPKDGHFPKHKNTYCEETLGNPKTANDPEKTLQRSNDTKTTDDLCHFSISDNNYYRSGNHTTACAQSPPHQKRIKTNGSLPRHNNHTVADECTRILPSVSRYHQRFPQVSTTPEWSGEFQEATNNCELSQPVGDHTQSTKDKSPLQQKIDQLVEIRAQCWKTISDYQRNMEELVVQENETIHELNLEHALITGEQMDEQGNQEKDIEELESLYEKKQLIEVDWRPNTSLGNHIIEKRLERNGNVTNNCSSNNTDMSMLETEINTLKSSIGERKDRLRDLMQQQDVLVQQLKDEQIRLQKQKDQLTNHLQEEMNKVKRIEEELEKLNLFNDLDIEDLKGICLNNEEAERTENEKGAEQDRDSSVELGKFTEVDETQYRTSDLWTGSDGAGEASSALTSDSDVTDSTENGKARRESLVNQEEKSDNHYEKYQNGNVQHNKSRQHAQRPLTRYLPVRGGDIDLRRHIESAGHQIVLCSHVDVTSSICKGYLHVLTGRWRSWKKRWVVFDRRQKTLIFYSDRSENKLKDGITFQCIEEVYVDHEQSCRSPNPRSTFCVKTDDQLYYLIAPNSESMRIWVDVIFTGAEGYRHFMPDFDP